MKTNKEEEILNECEEIIRALAKSMDGQERPQLIVALRSFFAQKLSEVRSEGAREVVEWVRQEREADRPVTVDRLEKQFPTPTN